MTEQNCKHGLATVYCALCNPSKDVHFSLTKFAQKYEDLNSGELAKKAVEGMTQAHQTKLLGHLLKIQFDQIRRQEVRDIEKMSSPWEREKVERSRDGQRRRAAEQRTRNSEDMVRPWAASPGAVWQNWRSISPQSRRDALELGEPEFARWLEAKGHLSYLWDYWSYRSDVALTLFEEKMRRKVSLELTVELLRSSFSLPSGRAVTWGEATIEEHESRVEFLLAQAGGTMETANRHRAAIAMLTDHGAHKLKEINLNQEPK